MANTFKSRHLKDVSNSSAETLLQADSGSQVILIGLQLSNTGSSEVKASVVLNNSADSDTGEMTLLNLLPIPAYSMVSVLVGDKIVMEQSDILKILSDTASSLNAVVSYLDID